jgi:hypothetical protein
VKRNLNRKLNLPKINMKRGCFLFRIISFGALTLGLSLADQPSGQPSGQGLDENQTTSDHPADHMDVNKEQADSMHPKSSDSGRASENSSSQTSPIKKGMLPADRPGQDRPRAGQGLDENQTTSELPADHMYGKRKGVNKERADTKHSKWSGNSRASENSSQTGPMKKGILPAHRPGQDRPKQVANNHGVAGEKRVDTPQSKLPVVNDFHQPGLNQPSTAVAKDGLMMNRARDPQEELTRRSPVGGGADASLPGVVRSRGAATPIIGQLMPSRAKTSTAVINGTGMKRKP